MNDVFRDYIKSSVAYLDDIVAHRNSLHDQLDHLRQALAKMRENQLYIKPEKCEFGRDQVRFLGH